MEESKNAVVSVQIPKVLKQMIERYTKMDTHVNKSDWLREAIREKARRDFPPEWFEELLVEAKQGMKVEGVIAYYNWDKEELLIYRNSDKHDAVLILDVDCKKLIGHEGQQIEIDFSVNTFVSEIFKAWLTEDQQLEIGEKKITLKIK